MQLARYRPWGDLASFGDEVNGFFGDLLGPGRSLGLLDQKWTPPLDISETKDAILVHLEVPGLEPSELEISIKEDTLAIRGEKKSEKEEKGKSFHRVERSYGSFYRTVHLPSDIDGEKVKATYKNGVVEIHLVKKPEAQKREIQIEIQ